VNTVLFWLIRFLCFALVLGGVVGALYGIVTALGASVDMGFRVAGVVGALAALVIANVAWRLARNTLIATSLGEVFRFSSPTRTPSGAASLGPRIGAALSWLAAALALVAAVEAAPDGALRIALALASFVLANAGFWFLKKIYRDTTDTRTAAPPA
jgi:hypothetical protein